MSPGCKSDAALHALDHLIACIPNLGSRDDTSVDSGAMAAAYPPNS
jgi:hypothetical protein